MKQILFLSFIFLCSSFTEAKTVFVSTTGNDNNTGAIDQPLATLMFAQELVGAGDTVYIRGGRYLIPANQIAQFNSIWAQVHLFDKSGNPGQPICYWAYQNEKPVFDLQNVKPENKRVIAFMISGSWLHFKGFEVVGTQVTQKGHTQSECFHNEGDNNIYEQLSMHDGQAIGYYLKKGSNNLVLNCDAYNNYDYTSEDGEGGNTDGFGCHPEKGGIGNVFKGCRSWFNSDDGFDLIRASEAVVIENCWTFYNGYSPEFKSLADGNGFKSGGWGLVKDKRVPDVIPVHKVSFCIAVNNKANGFYANHHPGGIEWYNNSAYRNGTNFNMLNRSKDFKADVSGYNHVLKNNLSFLHRTFETQHIDTAKCVLSNNSFNSDLVVKRKDFVSLDEKQLMGARKTNGDLPDINFMRLKKNSKLIDGGVNVGYPFNGKAPDLGALEY